MKIEFAADNKRLGQVLYALAHSSLRPEFSIEYTVADVEKCKNELLHKAIEDSIQKAQVLTTAANVKLGEIQAIDYSWGEIDFVTKPLNEMRLMECTECEMSAPGAYDIDIEADDINVIDTARWTSAICIWKQMDMWETCIKELHEKWLPAHWRKDSHSL